MTAHPIVHIEIAAQDPEKSGKFYSDLFGWKVEGDPQFNYYQFAGDGGPGGGFPQIGGQGDYKVGDVVPYIATDDIDAMLQKAQALGGKILLPKTEITGQGWFAFFADPTGNRIGLYTAMNPRQ
jgi:predicted enzyme related to lactoylglutathione lyase